MKAYAITDIGKKRSFNQDYAWMTTDEIGKLPNLFIEQKAYCRNIRRCFIRA